MACAGPFLGQTQECGGGDPSGCLLSREAWSPSRTLATMASPWEGTVTFAEWQPRSRPRCGRPHGQQRTQADSTGCRGRRSQTPPPGGQVHSTPRRYPGQRAPAGHPSLRPAPPHSLPTRLASGECWAARRGSSTLISHCFYRKVSFCQKGKIKMGTAFPCAPLGIVILFIKPSALVWPPLSPG